MRATVIFACVAALAGCTAADAQGQPAAPGSATQRSFPVGSFRSIALGLPHRLIVRVGGAPSVRAEGDARALSRIEVRVENGVLSIGRPRHLQKRRWVDQEETGRATIYVTAPTLEAAMLGGSGDIHIDRVQGDRFRAAIGGSGNIIIDSLRVRQADFAIGGSGDIRAAGRAERASISVAGSGDVEAQAMESATANVSVVGSGDVRTRVAGPATVSIIGSGSVDLGSAARCSVNRRGSGAVRCGTRSDKAAIYR